MNRLRLQVIIHPLQDLLHSADPVVGLTGAGQIMVLIFEQAESGFTSVHFQSGEHGQTIHHPAAVIRIRMDEQGGSSTTVRIFQRRMPPEFCCIGSGICTLIGNCEGNADSCPYCSGRRPIIGENDLFTLHREIALEWNYELNKDLIPEYVSENSGRKVWWKCKTCGNSWEAVIKSRTRGTGCPYCAGKRPIIKKSDMSTLYPNIAAEADHEINGTQTPEQFTAYSSKILGWKCAKCNHKWKMAIKRRTRGAKCPKCRRINKKI